MQDLLSAIVTLNQFGWLAVTVFMGAGFIFNVVLTRGHHTEVVDQLKAINTELRDQNRELRSENSQLRQTAAMFQSQTARATGAAASIIEQMRGG
jgi:cell division protein FtsB